MASSISTYFIKSIDPGNCESVADTMMRAQYTDAHWRLVFPTLDLAQIIEGCSQRLPFNLIRGRDSKCHLMAIDNSTGRAVGYSRWILLSGLDRDGDEWMWPEARIRDVSEEERKVFEAEYQEGCEGSRIEGLNGAMTAEMSPALERAEEEIMRGPGPWLSLDYMTVHPDSQRRGIGGLLLEAGLKLANDKGWKTVVMPQPQGIRVYEKHGFTRVTVVDQDDSKFGGDGHHVCVLLMKHPIAM